MKTSMKVGLGVGVVSGLGGIILYYVLCSTLDLTFEQLNPVSIMIASVIVNVIGALIYTKLRQKTAKPAIYYSVITIGVALLLSWYDWAYPAEPEIAGVANLIHALVATLSIVWIPKWINKNSNNK